MLKHILLDVSRIIQEVITIGVELVYVWALRRTLINRGRR